MLLKRRTIMTTLLRVTCILVALLCAPRDALAIGITWINAVVNDAGVTTVEVRFNASPDFFTVDQFNRQQDSFQIYPYTTAVGAWTSIVRGEEIHLGNGIPIRNVFTTTPSGYPTGGWGSIRTTEAFTLQSPILTFTTSLNTLGLAGPNFGYAIESYRFGSTVSSWNTCHSNQPCGLPEPHTLILLGVGLLAVVLVARRHGRGI